ncbi:MAG: hypothetical protein IKM00_02890 [Clostridia bacterium]|nr:hypothetical protein [Clostridia bacterium]
MTDLPYELGGTKIGAWGNLYPVDAPKEKLPYDQQFPKEPRAAKSLSSSETCAIGTLFAQSEWALRYAIPIRTSDQTARLFASFCNFFFQTKKKLIVSPYQREKFMKKLRRQTKKKQSFCFKIFTYLCLSVITSPV